MPAGSRWTTCSGSEAESAQARSVRLIRAAVLFRLHRRIGVLKPELSDSRSISRHPLGRCARTSASRWVCFVGAASSRFFFKTPWRSSGVRQPTADRCDVRPVRSVLLPLRVQAKSAVARSIGARGGSLQTMHPALPPTFHSRMRAFDILPPSTATLRVRLWQRIPSTGCGSDLR